MLQHSLTRLLQKDIIIPQVQKRLRDNVPDEWNLTSKTTGRKVTYSDLGFALKTFNLAESFNLYKFAGMDPLRHHEGHSVPA